MEHATTLDEGGSGIRALNAMAHKFREMEAAYIEGVRRNVQQFAAQLALELTGSGKAEILHSYEDNEEQRLLDASLAMGISLDARHVLPTNAGYWVVIGKKTFLGNKPALVVGAKSFLGWYVLAEVCEKRSNDIGKYMWGFVQEISRGIQRVPRASLPKRVPCALSLFYPGDWTGTIRECATAGGARQTVLCGNAKESAEGLWTDAIGTEPGWFTWLSLTPMSWERRLAWCRDQFLSRGELQTKGGSIAFEDVPTLLKLPTKLAYRLAETVCRLEGSQFQLGGLEGRHEIVYRAR